MDIYRDSSMFFKKRKGTTNKGTDYEHLIVARLALKLSIDDTIEDFKISSNDDNFGDFDDVIVEIYHTSGLVSKYALQLKYSNDRLLTKNSLADQRGNFSLKKYWDNFKKLRNVDDYKFILFTNREFDTSGKETSNSHGETLKVEFDKELKLGNLSLTIEETEDVLKISDGRCFNFITDVPETFFTKFFLCTNQVDIAKLETCIFGCFGVLGCCSTSSAPKDYIEFVRKWSEREGKKMKLNKKMLRKKLAMILMTPHIQLLNLEGSLSDRQNKLRNSVLSQKVIGFSEHLTTEVTKLWGNAWSMLPESEQNDAHKIGSLYHVYHDDLNSEGCTRLLWLMNKCPLIVRDHVTTKMAMQLCPDMSFVVLGPESAKKLSSIDNLDQQLQENFTFSLQGRATINLASKTSLVNIFTTDHLLASSFCIGEEEVLPTTHITRSVTRNVLDWRILNNFHFGPDGDVFVLITSYKGCKELKCQTLRIDGLSIEERKYEFCNANAIFVSENECSIEDFNQICSLVEAGKRSWHQFRIVKGRLEWVRGKGDITAILNHLVNDHYLTEEEILEYEDDNRLHCVCAGPGMGKTTLMKSLKNNSSPTTWTLLIYVKNYVGYFESCNILIGRVLSQIDDKLEREVVEVLIKQRSIKLMWDGLDEICSQNLSLLFNLIEEFAKMEITQWMTSRENLKEVLVRRFGVLPRDIREFDEEEQRNYVEKRLQCTKDDLNDIFAKIQSNIQLFPNNNILGIPLQIYILTELLLRDAAKYIDLLEKNIFSLVDLYRHFVDEKFKIYYNEKENIQIDNDLLMNRSLEFKLALTNTYEKLAAETLGFVVTNGEFLPKTNDPVGIIMLSSHAVEFIHTSFAEYFAASFLSKNRRIVASFPRFLSEEKYNNVRFFFDLLIANQCRPHIAVLYKNVQLLKSCTNEELVGKDLAGRNALQLASTWGQKYQILPVVASAGGYVIDDSNVSVARDSPEYCEIFDIVSKICDHNERDTLFNWSSLSYANKSRCLISFVKLLRCYKVNFRDYHSFEEMCSIIYYCVVLDCTEIFSVVRRLPTILNHVGADLLHVAIENDSLSCLKFLTEFDNPESNILITVGSRLGICKIVAFFVGVRNDISQSSNHGRTAITIACRKGYYDVVKLLIDNNAKHVPDNTGNTLLVKFWNAEIAKLLIDTGAKIDNACIRQIYETIIRKYFPVDNVNVKDEWDRTPLHEACSVNNYDIVKLLVDNGALINGVDERGQTPLHHVRDGTIVDYLVQNDADVEIRDNCGNTPLHLLADNGIRDSIKLLLPKADVNCQNRWNETPLYKACQSGHSDVVKLLVDNGADVNVSTVHGSTPLHSSCHSENLVVFQILLDNGAEVNARNEYDEMAIHLCCESGYYDIVKLLIDSGADVNSVTKYDETPIVMAKRWDSIVLLLRNNGAIQ